MVGPTPRERITIVGGGISSLAAAYHLSRTPELRARYEVTVYQMGWRLGGKLASGRNPDKSERNEEHGLHVWFGFYENAFGLARELYDRWAKPPGCPFQRWQDAFTPQSLTPIGEKVGGRWSYWPLHWPINADVPGDGTVGLSTWGVVTELVGTIESLFETLIDQIGLSALMPRLDLIPDRLERLVGWALDRFRPAPAPAPHQVLTQLRALLNVADLDGDGIPDLVEVAGGVRRLLRFFGDTLRGFLREHHPEPGIGPYDVAAAIDVAVAFACGLLNPAYGILEDDDLERIDHLEYRQWLLDNGGDPDIVNTWPGVRALYDTAFQYTDGDTTRPSYAAGAAARVVIRIGLTYKGTVLYLIRSGMGETIISPLYEVCRDQGVEFRFFHKLVDLELSPDTNVLTKVRFERQVDLEPGLTRYEPLRDVKGLRCWGHQPDWNQIAGGAAMKAAGVNWESHWNSKAPAGHLELVHGVDFDRCIVGASLGAFKVLNTEDRSFAQALIDEKPAFKAMTEQLPLVPSCGLQLWVDKTLPELGFDIGSPAMVAWAYPQDIWADMTPVIRTEAWPPGQEPKTCHYLCGTLGTELYKRPASATTTPDEGHALIRTHTLDQLDRVTGSIWPRGTRPGTQGLDFEILHAPDHLTGEDRFDWQYLRLNIEPTECCVGTPTDSTRFRMEPDETGVINLVFCGAWTRTSVNVSCVEGAVMSGMKAARAICGQPVTIVGEHFMMKPRPPHGVAASIPVPTPAPPPPVVPPSPSPSPVVPSPPVEEEEEPPMSSDLPPYQTTLGHGQQSVLPPGVVEDNRVYVFAVRIDAQQAEDFVNQRLAGPTLGELDYKVLGDVMLVSFLDGGKLTSTASDMGWLRDRECALSLLMAERRRDTDEVKLVGWMPYLFVDTSIAMATGREIWGFPKEMGQVTLPARDAAPEFFQATCRQFETLDRNTEGLVKPIVTVRRTSTGPIAAAFETLEDVTRWILGQLTDDSGDLWHWDDALKLAVDAAELAAHRRARVTNLKQFRDAEFPDRACYQAIVHSDFEFQNLRGGGVLDGDYRIEIATAQSHRIVSDLGLPGHDLDVMFGFYVDIDFRIPPGKTVWEA